MFPERKKERKKALPPPLSLSFLAERCPPLSDRRGSLLSLPFLKLLLFPLPFSINWGLFVRARERRN
tara:strand:+ start:292 stop:492 length:201 start_codon:yes stop_codon:yes gene_type:complete